MTQQDPAPETLAQAVLKAVSEKYPGAPYAEVAKQIRIAPLTLTRIIKAELSDFPAKSLRAVRGRAGSVVRLARALDLDVTWCLESVGLPKNGQELAADRPMPETILLTEEHLLLLIDIVKKLGRPIPLSLAAQLLALQEE